MKFPSKKALWGIGSVGILLIIILMPNSFPKAPTLGLVSAIIASVILYKMYNKRAEKLIQVIPEDKIKSWEEFDNERRQSGEYPAEESGSSTGNRGVGADDSGRSESVDGESISIGTGNEQEQSDGTDEGHREIQDESDSEPESNESDNAGDDESDIPDSGTAPEDEQDDEEVRAPSWK